MKLVPAQYKGKSVRLSEKVSTADIHSAKTIFDQAIGKLKRPYLWHDIAGSGSASFTLDGKGEQDTLDETDYIRVSIPGPGLGEGDGDDWVRVQVVDTSFDNTVDESFGIMLKVCPNPHHENTATAHFFEKGASSSLIIKRKGKKVVANYIGCNEKINTNQLSLMDKLRNVFVAGGALAGI